MRVSDGAKLTAAATESTNGYIAASDGIEYLVTAQGEGISQLSCAKMKDAPQPTPTAFKIVPITLPWPDDQGREETSVAIQPAEVKPAGKAGRHMPDSIRYGIESLHRAIREHGQEGAVHVDKWRGGFYAGHTGDNQDCKKVAFQRCRKELVQGQAASVDQDHYRLLDGTGSVWMDAHGFIQSLNLAARQASVWPAA